MKTKTYQRILLFFSIACYFFITAAVRQSHGHDNGINIADIVEAGWFGTVETKDGMLIALSPEEALVKDLQKVALSQLKNRVTSVTLTPNQEGRALASYSKNDDGTYGIWLLKRDSDGELQRNMKEFVRLIVHLGQIDGINQIVQSIKSNDVTDENAIRELLKYDFKSLKESMEFENNSWRLFCERNMVVEREGGDWGGGVMATTSFTEWLTTETAAERKGFWSSLIPKWREAGGAGSRVREPSQAK